MFGDGERRKTGWASIPIGKLCKLVNGKAFKPSDWTETGIPIIRIQNLNDVVAPFNFCLEPIEDKYFVHNGDLLFSWSGTPGTSFGAFIWMRGIAVLNQHIFHVFPKENIITKEFLKYSFDGRIDTIIAHSHGGVGLRHITKDDLEKIQLVVPPIPIQKDFSDFVAAADKSKFAVRILPPKGIG